MPEELQLWNISSVDTLLTGRKQFAGSLKGITNMFDYWEAVYRKQIAGLQWQ